jgi:transposase
LIIIFTFVFLNFTVRYLELPNDIQSLKDLVAVLLHRITHLESVITGLQVENTDLRNRLNLKSNNSSKPPSSDGLAKKPAIAKEPGKKSGGQFGHQGKTLQMVAFPDQTIIHHLSSCPCCSKIFSSSDVGHITQRRQVFDIPVPRLEVIEHQIGLISCCGLQHKGIFPEGVNSLVQYGIKIKALSVLLSTDYRMPFDKIEQLFSDLYACSFNESTAICANQSCFEALEPIESNIKSALLASDTVHFDETGMRVEAKLHWFHTASTTLFTYLFVHTKRGKEALNSSYSLLKDFKNWAIHDCWASYFDFKNCSHALCNAHIIRELENLKETGTLWANERQDFLFELYKISEKGTVIVPNKQIWLKKYQLICQKANQEEPPPIKLQPGNRGRAKHSKGRNLYIRLVKHQEAILAFAFIDHIPFTNNQAERDIRCIKIKQKVAMSFRTLKGAEIYARIQGFVSSIRKHNMNVFQQITKTLNKEQILFRAV